MRPTPTLQWFNNSLHKLCVRFPPPKEITIKEVRRFRFEEQSINTAILLKTARYVSGLNAGHCLLEYGFLQELGALQRSISDFDQDATFLALACILSEITDDHKTFLKAFWEEEPDYQTYLLNQKNKHEVSRRKIQSYIFNATNGGSTDHVGIGTAKYLSRIYSGYIHGAAPHLMDMYNPDVGRFEVDGTVSSQLLMDHRHDFENYLYRGVILFQIVAQAIGYVDLQSEAKLLHDQLSPYYTT